MVCVFLRVRAPPQHGAPSPAAAPLLGAPGGRGLLPGTRMPLLLWLLGQLRGPRWPPSPYDPPAGEHRGPGGSGAADTALCVGALKAGLFMWLIRQLSGGEGPPARPAVGRGPLPGPLWGGAPCPPRCGEGPPARPTVDVRPSG